MKKLPLWLKLTQVDILLANKNVFTNITNSPVSFNILASKEKCVYKVSVNLT